MYDFFLIDRLDTGDTRLVQKPQRSPHELPISFTTQRMTINTFGADQR